jgi:hypothetical protein
MGMSSDAYLFYGILLKDDCLLNREHICQLPLPKGRGLRGDLQGQLVDQTTNKKGCVYRMLVDVKAEYHTFGCRLSPLLCGVVLNRVQRLSVLHATSCFNWSRGRRATREDLLVSIGMHNRLRFSGEALC